ncbi:IclR family transcriptional regulator domain-containing protein [Microbacterium ulmi]|uniref:IclR family transcriptional regulator domain-containing protein n=1 Tax=Microbacterium ulmi TaxID=179095 RepID=UPI003132E8E2|nr:IclR family pca regulon transcriptional regulator [Microbacterium ulmi]
MADAAQDARGGEFVQSLDRGLAVIRSFDADRPSLTLSDVSRATGLSRASARRFLHTLVELGYVGTDGREFHLRPRLLELGYAYLSGLGLPAVAQPHLQRLSDETGESSSVAILDGGEIVYVARVAVRRIMSAAIGVGTRLPAFATSMGRAMLACGPDARRDEFLRTASLSPLTPYTITDRAALRAEFERIGAQGWSLVDQELEEGLRSVAAPVHDSTGAVVAAVNVAAPARRDRVGEEGSDFVAPLLLAVEGIERDLRHTRIRVG